MFRLNRLIIAAFVIIIFSIAFVMKNIPALPTISTESGVELPVVMYHSVLKNTELSGKYIITPSQFEKDIEYLEEKGYTTISAQQLVDYVDNGTPLPEKSVMLTFDDGCYNNYEYVLPILKKHNAHGIFCIVGKYTDDYTGLNEANAAYGYMRWIDVYNMSSSDNAEIANHSYDFHKISNGRRGAGKKRRESKKEYQKIFREDTEKTQKECLANTGTLPFIYTYPFGEYSNDSTEVLKDMGFRISFTCAEGVNIITRDSDCLFLLKRNNRPDNIGTAEFFSKLIH